MESDPKIEVGDWVRFYRDARFVIAEVRYIEKDACGYLLLMTDLGQVRARSVLEFKR